MGGYPEQTLFRDLTKINSSASHSYLRNYDWLGELKSFFWEVGGAGQKPTGPSTAHSLSIFRALGMCPEIPRLVSLAAIQIGLASVCLLCFLCTICSVFFD